MNKSKKNSLISPINKAIISERATLIVALSGGPDSIYLLYQLVELKKLGFIKELIVAHLDHEWRPESGDDLLFCQSVAQKYGLAFVGKKMSKLLSLPAWNGSKEEIGRKARQYFLKTVMDDYDADAIALAHHADDQQETFFIRLIRGTSLTGLCGMVPKSGPYIRPLLDLSKKEIVDFLDNHGIAYLTDPTNLSPDYLRNRIRNEIIPALRDCDKRFDNALLQTMGRLQQTEQYLQQVTRDLFSSMSSETSDKQTLNLKLFAQQPFIMQQRLLMHWLIIAQVSFIPTEPFLREIIKFLMQEAGGTHTLGPDWSIVKRKNGATIIKN